MLAHELDKVRRAGARARAKGASLLDNPHHASRNLPANSGERSEIWVRRVVAWDEGWLGEDRAQAGSGSRPE